jgi:hypothetical protein
MRHAEQVPCNLERHRSRLLPYPASSLSPVPLLQPVRKVHRRDRTIRTVTKQGRGRYDDLMAGFRDGSISLALKRDNLTVLEDAPVPPPTSN